MSVARIWRGIFALTRSSKANVALDELLMQFKIDSQNNDDLSLHLKLLETWTTFLAQSFTGLPEHCSLNIARYLLDQKGPVRKRLQSLERHSYAHMVDPQLWQELFSFPEGILEDPQFVSYLDKSLQVQIDAHYPLQKKLMGKRMQERFLALEYQKIPCRLRVVVKEQDHFSAEGLQIALQGLAMVLAVIYYANTFKVSYLSYGHQRLSYTWLEPAYAAKLEGIANLSFVGETIEDIPIHSGGMLKGCRSMVFSGLRPVIEQIITLILAIKAHINSTDDLISLLGRDDFFIKKELDAMDLSAQMKQQLLLRIHDFAGIIFQGLTTTGLLQWQWDEIVQMDRQEQEASGWSVKGFLN